MVISKERPSQPCLSLEVKAVRPCSLVSEKKTMLMSTLTERLVLPLSLLERRRTEPISPFASLVQASNAWVHLLKACCFAITPTTSTKCRRRKTRKQNAASVLHVMKAKKRLYKHSSTSTAVLHPASTSPEISVTVHQTTCILKRFLTWLGNGQNNTTTSM